jgi:hypothetical protein
LRRDPADVLVEILKTVDVEIAHLTDTLILHLDRLLVLVDLVQPAMERRGANVAVAELAKRNNSRLTVDGYFILGFFVRFAGGIGAFAFRLIIGSCVSVVGGGIVALRIGFGYTSFATLPFTFGGRLAGS